MEKVFWLMWLADIVTSIGVVGFICLIAYLIGIVFCFLGSSLDGDSEKVKEFSISFGWLLIPVAIALIAPSSKTIHLLVVASAAEAASDTRLGKKSIEAFEAVLDKVITESKLNK